LGLDQTVVYKFDAKGSLVPNGAQFGRADAGAGPRHFALHPNGRFGYVVNEMGSDVSVFAFDGAGGVLHPVETISTIPKGFAEHNDDAEIAIHPSGKFLYASNRGHDSIAVFTVDSNTGHLTVVEYVPTQGKIPRSFEIDPTGSLLFAENQKSNDIVVFRIDQQTGQLTPTGKVLEVVEPVCVKFVAVE